MGRSSVHEGNEIGESNVEETKLLAFRDENSRVWQTHDFKKRSKRK